MIRNCILTVPAIGLLAVVVIAGEAEYTITRFTIDGGGVMRSTGGDLELSATIGQPDAGVLTGGDIELSGGFWFALAPTDCNEDGLVGLSDFGALFDCLGGPGAPAPIGCNCFDTDGNGETDLYDVAENQRNFDGA